MKVFACLSLLSVALAVPENLSSRDVQVQDEIMDFASWAKFFGKSYPSALVEAERSGVYNESVAFIRRHNEEADAGRQTFRMGVNQFSDMTNREWAQYALSPIVMPVKPEEERNVELLELVAAAATVDWREKGAVTPVKNQQTCGSCWAFSTTGSTEGAYFLATGALRSLSEEQLVDCAGGKFGNNGCKGGIMEKGFQYIIANKGIDSEADYAYTAKDGECWTKAEARHVATVDSFKDVKSKDEAQLSAAVMMGPVSVAVEADHPYFQHYKSGVLTNASSCGDKLDHGVLVVGMTETSYIVKNSWGPTWGDKGYLQLARGQSMTGKEGEGMCGVAVQPSYPVVTKGKPLPVPPPTPGKRPVPTPPTYKNPYGDPSAGPCEKGEKAIMINGLKGNFCSPECSSTIACPTKVPTGTTAKGECILSSGGAPTDCALVCKKANALGQMTMLDDLACPAKASCKPISTTAICTYDSR